MFLSSDGHVKLGDFGCAIKLQNSKTMLGELTTFTGTAGMVSLRKIKSLTEKIVKISQVGVYTFHDFHLICCDIYLIVYNGNYTI